ncbi:topoisomerase DNA-binding C4 zinc finger domain-containing protein [Candidatus Pacearchaeota archaeon]|nr:topoisomerase DNA-binding C4 zinc finger domain-containing protein [Candidatus Pacearchaeota archaeon]
MTEKEEKPTLAELTTVESPGRPSPASMLESGEEGKKNKTRKIRKKKFEKSENIKISAPEKDSILIITEKPQAAQKIASALGKPEKNTILGVSYYEVSLNGKKIIIASAVGHLFNLTYKEGQKGWPIFELEWKPSYLKGRAAFTKRYFDLLKKLTRKASEIILATDFDIEGEVIGWNILRFICQRDNAKRMKFSTLTANELKRAYDSPLSQLEWGNAYAGETRHYVDWLYGVNLSRALMSSLKKNGSFKILSIGRVQGPALKIIIDRERDIKSFKPVPYWQVFANIKRNSKETTILELKHPKDIFDESILEIFKSIREGIAETIKSEELISPPHPFDLTTLQREAYRLYKINPSETLSIAQKLYLDSLISYPRTSSQKIPFSIEPKKILKALEKKFPEAKLALREKPVEGKKSDPAHPSIHPTGEIVELSERDEKIYSLIARRFIAVFSPDARTANKKIVLNAVNKEGNFITYKVSEKNLNDGKILKEEEDEHENIKQAQDNNGQLEKSSKGKTQKEVPITFVAFGLTFIEKGWTSFYPIKIDEQEIPDLIGRVKIDKIRIEEKETMPPSRFTPASLVSILERKNLGTKTTRSMIVDTLFDRGYLDGRSIQATPLGITLIESLEKYSPIIIDENLTRQLEEEMENIQLAKSDFQKRESEVIEKTKRLISDISKEFKAKEIEIGKELMKGIEHQRNEQIQNNTLNPCPACKEGKLRILYSKKSKRYFIGCSNYPKCTQTFSLPPNALIKKAETQCPADSFPKLLAIRKGKRPWEFCFNPQCPVEKEKREKRENQIENNEN